MHIYAYNSISPDIVHNCIAKTESTATAN